MKTSDYSRVRTSDQPHTSPERQPMSWIAFYCSTMN